MIKKIFIAGISTLLWLGAHGGELQLGSLFQENMILQRNQDIPVWGKAKAGTKVVVTLADSTVKGTADCKGNWKVTLPPREADGNKLKFTVKSGSESTSFTNVVMGEVWICSGQSNMQMGYGKVPNVKALAKSAKNIRTFGVANTISFNEEEFCKGLWREKAPPSAVPCAFAIELQKRVNVPVGIILSAWGSSSIEGWMPKDLQTELPHFKAVMDEKLGGDNKILCEDIIATFNKKGKLEYSNDPKVKKLITGAPKHIKRANVFARTRPNLIYNAMMHPLAPYAVRGIAWYQGEANSTNLQDMKQYGTSLNIWGKRLRKQFQNEQLHFMVVMLPGYGFCSNKVQDQLENPNGHSWAWMRESQLNILGLPNTSVATTIDLGDVKNIHPTDKAPIGKRLALLAQRDTLGENVVAEGPVMDSVDLNGRELIVSFENAEGMSTLDGDEPKAFWISGDDKVWHRAKAVIDGSQITLSCKSVADPKYIRYAFSAMPEVNLVNKAGLPARPFRTDSFQP